ncbi:hypothetical protein [Nocardia crassostreae]|uniref:hypothetical protein n=1 Tax=Nocardia crassostreae TaxID=53428 RepID=UPI000831859D|nr:hypothetical protein [Nocardia crassostreae]
MAEANSSSKDRVLSIGLHPSAVDFTPYPGQSEATLTARIQAGEDAMRAAGIDFTTCLVTTDPEAAEAKVRECAAAGPFRVAMIGAGVRMAPELTELFERLINTVTEVAPGIRFAFNTSPESTIDAMRRGLRAD